MAIDASRLKRRLPEPPPPEEGATGIERQPVQAPAPAADPEPAPVLDGRSMRATGRVMQLNLKITPETKATILRLAKDRNQLVTELIEDAIAALQQGSR